LGPKPQNDDNFISEVSTKMKIVFIQNFWFEFIGTMYLSAILKEKGHETDLFIFDGEEGFIDSVIKSKPDIVGFYTITGSHLWAINTACRIKGKIDTFTLFGGPHATFFPEIIERNGVDGVLIGESEYAIAELVEKIQRKQDISTIKNLWLKQNGNIIRNELRPLIDDLDDIPFPDREIYYKYSFLRNNPNKSFLTGRGCPYACSFCFNASYRSLYRKKGDLIRRISPPRMIRELSNVISKFGAKSIRFDDDLFAVDGKWSGEFLELYRREINLPFTCYLRANIVTEEIVRTLKMGGCFLSYFGIETGNEENRHKILKKNITNKQIEKTAYLLRKHAIEVGTFNMLCLPGETIDQAYETINLNRKIKADYLWCSIIQPYPKTEIEKISRELGYLDKDFNVDNFRNSYFKTSILRNKDYKSLNNLQKLFYVAVKFPIFDPIIKRLIKYEIPWLLNTIFYLTYGYRYIKTYRISIFRLMMMGIRLRKYM
jgi:anaerobic magnesium-protoporphyrin IX monomethyl ester cyclase